MKISIFYIIIILNLESRLIAQEDLTGINLNKKFFNLLPNWQNHEYNDIDATVRLSKDIPGEESAYIKKRLQRNKKALEKFLDIKFKENNQPTIAFCCSGGGYRAMISALGSMIGAQSSGLLETAAYISSLSGSTWGIVLWSELGSPARTTTQYLVENIRESLLDKLLSEEVITSVILKKYYSHQNFSLVDLYGALLAETLLKGVTNDPQDLTLSQHVRLFDNNDWLYPIYTSVIVPLVKKKIGYEWIEYTPHEIGSTYLGAYIPTWAFGRQFNNGISVNRASPESLGSLMGIWGSAFSANFEEILNGYKDKIKNTELEYIFEKLVSIEELGEKRIADFVANNFSYKIGSSPRKDDEKLILVDGGLSCNLPIPPLVRPARKIDIIIVLDASGDIENMPELYKAADYCKKNKLKFPDLSEYWGSKYCKVFEDKKDPKCPLIIYMPLLKNKNYSASFDPAESCGTFRLAYSKEDIIALTGLTKYNMKHSTEIIKKAIKNKIFKNSKINQT